MDSTGQAVPNADVSLVRALNVAIVAAKTDASGTARLTVVADTGELQVVVRKLGYSRGDRLFRLASHDTSTLVVSLVPVARALPSVVVSAQQDVKMRSYHIAADDIEKSTRPIFDALDVVRKLRPDMLSSRSPEICADSSSKGEIRAFGTGRKDVGHIAKTSALGGLSNVWSTAGEFQPSSSRRRGCRSLGPTRSCAPR